LQASKSRGRGPYPPSPSIRARASRNRITKSVILWSAAPFSTESSHLLRARPVVSEVFGKGT
jgi:hypothetical protein